MAPLNAGLFLEAEHRLLEAIRPRHQLSTFICKSHFPRRLPTALNHHPSGGLPSFLRPPGFNAMRWYWNINQLSIAYAFRPRLRSRLTPGGLTSPGKPWVYGGQDSHLSYATYVRICSCLSSSILRKIPSPVKTMLPYHRILLLSGASVVNLSPVESSAQDHLTSELLRFL